MEFPFFKIDSLPGNFDAVVDITDLGRRIRSKRESFKLSLRAVAQQTQVSASTLSRIENGSGVPDTPTLAKLSVWLNIPNGISFPTGSSIQSTPDVVEAHLRADQNLTPEKAQALAELFRLAYNQFAPINTDSVEGQSNQTG